jgi:hypothetical protein
MFCFRQRGDHFFPRMRRCAPYNVSPRCKPRDVSDKLFVSAFISARFPRLLDGYSLDRTVADESQRSGKELFRPFIRRAEFQSRSMDDLHHLDAFQETIPKVAS